MSNSDFGESTYLLVLQLVEPADVMIGAKGVHHFPAGYYVYAGSARRNSLQRVGRHLSGTGKLRWHIDYLRTVATPVGALFLPAKRYGECALAAAVRKLAGSSMPCKGFGASDCSCPTHLFHFEQLCLNELPHIKQGTWLRG